MPMFIMAFVFVIIYQVYQRRKKNQEEYDKIAEKGGIASIAAKLAKKSGRRLTPKAR